MTSQEAGTGSGCDGDERPAEGRRRVDIPNAVANADDPIKRRSTDRRTLNGKVHYLDARQRIIR